MSGASPPPLDARRFRQAMGSWATGVSIVTARHDGVDHGATVNAFLSVSTNPPSILVSLGHEADTTPAVEQARAFAVNLLAFDQRPLSERFGRPVPPAEKFAGIVLHRGATGAALLPDTLAAMEARVTHAWTVSDHRLFVGEVVELHAGREVAPLLFVRSHYTASDGTRTLTLDPGS